MNCVNYFEKKVNIQEAICLMETKINEIVEMYNRVNADHEVIAAKVAELERLIDYLIGEGLAAEVKKKLEEWLVDGTIANLINGTILLDIQTRLSAIEEITKYCNSDRVVNIYVAPYGIGSPNNTGLVQGEPTLIKNAFDLVKKAHDLLIGLSGTYIINLAPGTYIKTDLNQSITTLKTLNRLIIKGPDVALGETPTAIFDGEGEDKLYEHGMSFVDVNSIEVKNIKFVNFRVGTGWTNKTRCGVAFTNCNALTTNIHADGCGWSGISAAGGRLYTSSGKISNCRIGINAQFNCQVSLGVYDQSLAENKRTNITGTVDGGVRLTDGTVGHIDYMVFNNNEYGIVMTHHSDANLVENTLLNNRYGLALYNASSWYDTNNTFNQNTNDIVSYDGSSETGIRNFKEVLLAVANSSKGTSTLGKTVGLLPATIKSNRLGVNSKMIFKSIGELSIVNAETGEITCGVIINGVEYGLPVGLTTTTGGYKQHEVIFELLDLGIEYTLIQKIYVNGTMVSYKSTLNIPKIEMLSVDMFYTNKTTGSQGWKSFSRELKVIG